MVTSFETRTCPECDGNNTNYWRGFHSKDRLEPDEPEGWECEDCGHHWSTLGDELDARADYDYEMMKEREWEERDV